MGIILWIIFGGFAGWVASMIMNTDSQQGILLNVLIGIAGAVIGGSVMSYFGETGIDGFNLYSFGVAVLGAVLLLAVIRLIQQANSASLQ